MSRWTRERCGVLLGSLCGVLLLGLACWAHNGEPPFDPGPPQPPSTPGLDSTVERVYPPRWSWIHWWEANRDPYLDSARQGGPDQGPGEKTLDEHREKTFQALMSAAEIPVWQMQASASLALGCLKDPRAKDRLAALAGSGGKDEICLSALVALGLLDTADAQQTIIKQKMTKAILREASIVALGLCSQSAADVVTGLQKTVMAPGAGPATAAAWALRRRKDPQNCKFLTTVLLRTTSPWLASEAILALGHQGDLNSAPLLTQILLAAKRAEDLPVWQTMEKMRKVELACYDSSGEQKAAPTYENAYKRFRDDMEQWMQGNPNGSSSSSDGADNPAPVTGKVQIGVSDTYKARLRGSAAIALGLLDCPASRRALLKSLEEKDDGYNQLYKGFVIMALGRVGEPAALPVLFKILGERKPRAHRRFTELTLALRGNVALALGLYARARQTPQGPVDNPGTDKVLDMLARLVADTEETLEVRTACVLALGLSGRTENLKRLQATYKSMGKDDELLIGYTLLARGMLGDRNIIEPAAKFLAKAGEKTDTAGLLARRAAVTGLGLLGSREVIPVLIKAWCLHYHVQREVATAFGVNQAYGVTDQLIDLMKTSPDDWERVYDAYCLGELFLQPRPSRLAWLLNDSNYMMKNLTLIPYATMANQFLYNHLIPCFGDEWR